MKRIVVRVASLFATFTLVAVVFATFTTPAAPHRTETVSECRYRCTTEFQTCFAQARNAKDRSRCRTKQRLCTARCTRKPSTGD
jgi:hypothetical protein